MFGLSSKAWFTDGVNALKSTIYFIVGVGVITAALVALVLGNGYVVIIIPGFEVWTLPLIIALVVYVAGRSILLKAQESDKLKYEFITVATHKLRTPLTRIRWAIPEVLARAGNDVDLREGIRRIDDANNRLIELTGVLMEASNPGGTFDYLQIAVDLRQLAWNAVKHFATQISEKKLTVTVDGDDAPSAYGDTRRLNLVVEVLVENAIMYTPKGGSVRIVIRSDRLGVRFAVTDTGIGVARTDRENIFSSFYRTNAARTVDTEGVGLGLSLAKRIIERQHGRIGVDSVGEGKGSTFWFVMPATAQ